jgi:hypothetical protein
MSDKITLGQTFLAIIITGAVFDFAKCHLPEDLHKRVGNKRRYIEEQ